MNILVFSEYYFPERFLITDICEQLIRDGNEVTVITGRPNYNFPEGKVPTEYRDGSHDEEEINGVHVLRCKVFGRRKSKLQLILNYLSYVINACQLQRKLKTDYDWVFVYQLTPVLQLIPAIKYCKRNSLKLICYCLDTAPKSGEKYLKHLGCVRQVYATISKKLYSACDFILVTSKSFIEYMTTVNSISADKLEYLPQHASDSLLKDDLSKECDAVRQFYFAGNLGNGASLDTILKAAHELSISEHDNFQIHFVGDGSAKDDLKKMVCVLGLNHCIVFDNAVSMSEMPQIYKKADALLVTLRKGQFTIPGKLQAYMATGKPILGAMDGSGKELIAEAQCGLCTDAENYHGLAELMKAYIGAPEDFIKLGENGKKFFTDNFTLRTYIDTLMTISKQKIEQ